MPAYTLETYMKISNHYYGAYAWHNFVHRKHSVNQQFMIHDDLHIISLVFIEPRTVKESELYLSPLNQA